MREEEKARIVIELSREDYESLITLKNLLNISWRDVLVAGAIWWCNELKLEERIERIREQVNKIAEQKN
jgi:hypothetical protein